VTKKLFIIGVVLIGALITVHGCYTIIKHPSVMQTDDEAVAEHANGNRDCVSCHQDYHQYPYGYYYGYYPNYYWDYNRWGQYYAYPWWWDTYYDNDNSGGGTPVEPGLKPGKQRGIEPPYSNPLPPILSKDSLGVPIYTPTTPTTPVITNPGGGTTTGGTVTNPPVKPAEPAKVEDTKPPKRRGDK
jgi:hypothetical protein